LGKGRFEPAAGDDITTADDGTLTFIIGITVKDQSGGPHGKFFLPISGCAILYQRFGDPLQPLLYRLNVLLQFPPCGNIQPRFRVYDALQHGAQLVHGISDT
jgi:hypothetical protein